MMMMMMMMMMIYEKRIVRQVGYLQELYQSSLQEVIFLTRILYQLVDNTVDVTYVKCGQLQVRVDKTKNTLMSRL